MSFLASDQLLRQHDILNGILFLFLCQIEVFPLNVKKKAPCRWREMQRCKRAKEIHGGGEGKGSERLILPLLLKDRRKVADTALPIR